MAAIAFLNQLPTLTDEQLRQDYLHPSLDWLLPLMPELADAQALRLVKLALTVSQTGGARLAGAVKPQLQTRTIKLITELEVPLAVQYFLLGLTGSDQAIAPLKAALATVQPGDAAKSYLAQVAVRALRQLATEAAVAELLNALAHPDSEVQAWVAWALAEIGNEAAIAGLLKSLSHESGVIQGWAAWALGQIGTLEAVQGLINALQSPEAEVRWKAASALGKTWHPEAEMPLIQALSDPDTYVQGRAAFALRHFGNDDVIARLLNTFATPSVYVWTQAILALGAIATPTAIAGLLDLLNHPHEDVRIAVISALRDIGTEAVLPGLLKGLQDPDFYVRGRAVEALYQIESETAVSGLLIALQDPSEYVSDRAVQALAALGTPRAIAGLQQLLKNESQKLRVQDLIDQTLQHRQTNSGCSLSVREKSAVPSPQHPELPPLIITSHAEASRYILNSAIAGEVKYLLSIGSPGIAPPRGFQQVSQRLRLEFDDIDAPFDDSEYVLPTLKDIWKTIEFAAAIPQWEGTLLVHCQAGISRSAAIALTICAHRLGRGREAEALAYVLSARPAAHPNYWIVELADMALERDGKLVQALQQAGVFSGY